MMQPIASFTHILYFAVTLMTTTSFVSPAADDIVGLLGTAPQGLSIGTSIIIVSKALRVQLQIIGQFYRENGTK